MERLTRRINNNKIAAIKGTGCNYSAQSFDCRIDEGKEKLKVALERLADYEDIGTPKELKELKENGAFTGMELAQIAGMQKEWKAYKDAEEQGLLVRLPCPIGTTVWDICGMDIRENVVSGIECGKGGKQFLWANHDEWIGELNDLVFLTREEAEKKLGEIQNDKT